MASLRKERYSFLVEVERKTYHTFSYWMDHTEPCVFTSMKIRPFERDGIKYIRCIVFCKPEDHQRCKKRIDEYIVKLNAAV